MVAYVSWRQNFDFWLLTDYFLGTTFLPSTFPETVRSLRDLGDRYLSAEMLNAEEGTPLTNN